MKTLSRTLAATAALVTLLASSAPARAGDGESSFVLTGYVSTQGGIFLDPEKADYEYWNFSDSVIVKDPVTGELRTEYKRADDQPLLQDGRPNSKYREFVRRHGDKFLTPSMLRSTLLLEADWTPWEHVSLHAIFRGVRSLQVGADDDAQPPVPGDVANKRAWVQDNYYSENDLRELYLAVQANDWLSFRVGRQQVSWGEIGQYRLLDVVNPTDSTWHFSVFESFEDQRVPNWMLNTTFDFMPIEASLDLLYIPMLDSPEDLVNVPLTFVGAWGLPPAPVQDDKGIAGEKIARKLFEYPGGRLEDGRVGARWKGSLFDGRFNYTLVYFYGHQLTPPIPKYYMSRAPISYTDLHGNFQPFPDEGIDVYLEFPRQHTVGFSTEFAIDNPVGVAIRLEAAFEPNRVYPTNSLKTTELQKVREAAGLEPVEKANPDDHREPYLGTEGVDPWASKTYFWQMKKHVVNYAVQFMRPTMIRWLNPSTNFLLIFQVMHSMVLDFDASEKLIDIPGYDSSTTKEHDIKLVGVVRTSYFYGLLTPQLTAVYALPRDAILSVALNFNFANDWRVRLAGNLFFAEDPYRGIGLFRDRDEINLTVMYQF